MRYGSPGFGGGLLHGRFELHSGEAVVHWGGAQDQPPALRCGDGVEGVGRSTRTAGEWLQILDDHAVTENRPQNAREFVDHPGSLLDWPKENIRCATRRICISSAPSVIRYRRWCR